jgi:hypothetical protein
MGSYLLGFIGGADSLANKKAESCDSAFLQNV